MKKNMKKIVVNQSKKITLLFREDHLVEYVFASLLTISLFIDIITVLYLIFNHLLIVSLIVLFIINFIPVLLLSLAYFSNSSLFKTVFKGNKVILLVDVGHKILFKVVQRKGEYVKLKMGRMIYVFKLPEKRTKTLFGMPVFFVRLNKGVLIDLEYVNQLSGLDDDSLNALKEYVFIRDLIEDTKSRLEEAVAEGNKEKIELYQKKLDELSKYVEMIRKQYRLVNKDNKIVLLTDNEELLKQFENVVVLTSYDFEHVYDFVSTATQNDIIDTVEYRVQSELLRKKSMNDTIIKLGAIVVILVLVIVFAYLIINHNQQPVVVKLTYDNISQMIQQHATNTTQQNVTTIKI